MDLELTETQTLLRDALRELLEKEVPFSRVRELEAQQRADAELWERIALQGWLGAPFPAELGGGDGGLVEAGLLVEEVQRRAALVPVAEALACGAAIRRSAPAPRAAELVRGIAAGALRPVPAVLEAGDRFGEVATRAADGTLRGEKYFVDYAEFATHHLVAARDGDGLGLYWVAADGPGVKVEPVRAIGRTPQARVRYDGVPGERLCGAEGVEELVQISRALASVQIVACMQQSLDQTVAYTSVREQFGRPIGTFQAVQHHAANMAIELTSARFLAYEALDALERGTATAAQVAAAKAAASQSAPEVLMLGHQLHGGQGFIEENDLYFFTVRGRDRALAWGTAEECLEIVADGVDAEQDWL